MCCFFCSLLAVYEHRENMVDLGNNRVPNFHFYVRKRFNSKNIPNNASSDQLVFWVSSILLTVFVFAFSKGGNLPWDTSSVRPAYRGLGKADLSLVLGKLRREPGAVKLTVLGKAINTNCQEKGRCPKHKIGTYGHCLQSKGYY